METKIIGFINQKLPEVTHINHYEEFLKSKVAANAPKIAIEWIFPKTMSGFDGSIKTDVLGIWACKFEAKEADLMMQKLLPPWAEGKYYVSFDWLEEETKKKAYKHLWVLIAFKIIITFSITSFPFLLSCSCIVQ